MKSLRIAYDDFWGGWNPSANYFTSLLKQKYKVILDQNNPDLVFYSVFGDTNIARHCPKIFFTGEDREPQSDAATVLNFTFRSDTDNNNYRLPLWVLYIDWFGLNGQPMNPGRLINPNLLTRRKTRKDWDLFLYSKPNIFALCSNDNGARSVIMPALNHIGILASYGRFENNTNETIPPGELAKLEVMQDHRFSLCIENSVSDGYVTEKLLHGFAAGTLPIYYGDSQAALDFNSGAFFNLSHDTMAAVEQCREILGRPITDYMPKFFESCFAKNTIPDEVSPEAILAKIEEVL